MTIVATPAVRPAPTPEVIAKATGEESFVRAVVAAIAAPLAVVASQVLSAMGHGNPDAAHVMDWSLLRRRLMRMLRGPLGDEAQRGARRAMAEVGVTFEFVPVRAIEAAERLAESVADGMVATSQRAVADFIVRAQREGLSVDETTAAIRQVIGLHPRWASAVANRRRALQREGVAPARIDKLVADYRHRLLTHQARTIARSELLRSSNMGAMEGYRQAVAAGAYPEGVVRQWVTARIEGGRVCTICRPLNGATAEGLDEPFATLAGPVLHPPAHPSCRCRLILRPATTRSAA